MVNIYPTVVVNCEIIINKRKYKWGIITSLFLSVEIMMIVHQKQTMWKHIWGCSIFLFKGFNSQYMLSIQNSFIFSLVSLHGISNRNMYISIYHICYAFSINTSFQIQDNIQFKMNTLINVMRSTILNIIIDVK